MKKITDGILTLQMQILWQNLSQAKQEQLSNLINGYFDKDRAEGIINKLGGK